MSTSETPLLLPFVSNILPLLLIFAPTIILVLMGICGKRVHRNAIYIISIYTLVWGVVFLIMTLTHPTDSSLGPWLSILSCAVVGGTLLVSTRDIRLAKVSAAVAIAATVLLPFTMN